MAELKANEWALLVRESPEGLLLCAPRPGLFSEAQPRGALLAQGNSAGVLHVLGRPFSLRVPEGVEGRVVGTPGKLVRTAVEHGTPLYRLEPLASSTRTQAAGPATHAGSSASRLLRSPYSGRYWLCPSPNAPAFVASGSELASGAALGLIEVMKTFTTLHYRPGGELPARARVVRVLIADGAEVAEGDALFELEAL